MPKYIFGTISSYEIRCPGCRDAYPHEVTNSHVAPSYPILTKSEASFPRIHFKLYSKINFEFFGKIFCFIMIVKVHSIGNISHNIMSLSKLLINLSRRRQIFESLVSSFNWFSTYNRNDVRDFHELSHWAMTGVKRWFVVKLCLGSRLVMDY